MGFRDTNQDLLGCVHQVPERRASASSTWPPRSSRTAAPGTSTSPSPSAGTPTSAGLQRRSPVAHPRAPRRTSRNGRLGHPRGAGAIRQRSRQVSRDAVRAPEALVPPRARQPRAARAAPHRPGGLERLPEPQLLLRRPRRILPDHAATRRAARAESVLIAGLFVVIGRRLRRALPRRMGLADEARAAREHSRADGEDRPRARLGRRLVPARLRHAGTRSAPGNARTGRSTSSPTASAPWQGSAGRPGTLRRPWTRCSERLDTPYGIVLHDPPYAAYHAGAGRDLLVPAGYKENAGVFCHNNPWIMIAEMRRRARREGLRVLQEDRPRLPRGDLRSCTGSSPTSTPR